MASSASNKVKIKNNRTKPLDSDVQFLLWNYPKYELGNAALSANPLGSHPNVTSIARAQISNINSNQGPCYFTGYDSYSITKTNNFYSKEHATNTGKRWADFFELQGLVYNPNNAAEQFGENATRYAGGIFAQDWGTFNSGTTVQQLLMGHQDDLFWYTDAATNNKIGIPTGWHKNACAALHDITYLQNLPQDATLSLGDWILWACHTLKNECDNRNLCYPKYLAWDWENHVGLYYSADSNQNQGCLIGHNGVKIGSTYVDNMFDKIMEDPRFSTEVVYEEFDGKQWIGKTLYDAYTEAGFNKDKNKGYTAGNATNWIYWFQGINRDFVKAMEPYYHRINDHALNLAMYEPAKKIFPNIICGNYNIHHGLNSSLINQRWDVRNAWYRTPAKDFAVKKYLKADYQCPVCYSPDLANYKYSPNQYQTTATIEAAAPNGFYFYNAHNLGKTNQEVYNNYMVQQVRNCTAISKTIETGNPTSCIPWIEPPQEETGKWGDGVLTYSATYDDILNMLKAHYKLGVRTWFVFNPSFAQDIWVYGMQSTGDSPQTRVAIFVKLVDEFVAWVKSQKTSVASATITSTETAKIVLEE